eukprot:1595148-Pyramimonas_sp.AAC.1
MEKAANRRHNRLRRRDEDRPIATTQLTTRLSKMWQNRRVEALTPGLAPHVVEECNEFKSVDTLWRLPPVALHRGPLPAKCW